MTDAHITHSLLTDSGLPMPDLAYGVHINLEEPDTLPRPYALAKRRADIAVSLNGRTLEMSYEEFAVKLGLAI